MNLDFSVILNQKNLLAFSAGVDSTALFFLLLKQNIPFDIAIVDYNLRIQSKDEISYAKELALKYNKKIFVKDVKLENNSNFDEKYKRNYFRHNFSNKFLEEFSNGVKKSFEYLQNDLNSLNIQSNPIKKIEELEIFLNQKDDNLNIRTIDLSLKRRGFILSNAQRNEILKQKEITISKKINISILEDYIWIAPNCNEIMDKKSKESYRTNKIPKNIRAYIFWKNIDLKELIL